MQRRTFIVLAGAIAGWPFPSRAQKAVPVIGYLQSASKTTYPAAFLAAFHEGLADAGYVEGKNLAVEYRWAENDYNRLQELAKDLAQRKVAATAATGGLVSALAAKAATSAIPIVFSMGDDPVAAGVVASFAHPGGNLTGVSFFVLELGTKLLDLAVVDLLPSALAIALLANPSRPSYKPIRDAVEEAARARQRQLVVLDAAAEKDFGVVTHHRAGFALCARHRASPTPRHHLD